VLNGSRELGTNRIRVEVVIGLGSEVEGWLTSFGGQGRVTFDRLGIEIFIETLDILGLLVSSISIKDVQLLSWFLMHSIQDRFRIFGGRSSRSIAKERSCFISANILRLSSQTRS